jgi:hypothetical protein
MAPGSICEEHSFKSALCALQRAGNHGKRAYAIRRRDIAFIVST